MSRIVVPSTPRFANSASRRSSRWRRVASLLRSPASRRGLAGRLRAGIPDPVEDVEVREVRGAEQEQEQAELAGQELDRAVDRLHLVDADPEEQERPAEVDEVEADDEQLVDRGRELRLAGEHVDEEH